MIKSRQIQVAALIFLALSGWWVYIAVNGLQGTDRPQAELFGASYGLMALYGGVVGLFVSKKWGGFKSQIGKAVGFFALGLLAQEFGQLTYSYLGMNSEVPYPSIGDIGYFGSVILYTLGVWQLAKAAGVGFSLKDRNKKIIATILPLVLLTASYLYFLRGYEFDFSSVTSSIAVILDFGYPLGQTVYLVIALMTYLLSRSLLGGIMKNVVLFLLFALAVQYLADFMFLYQTHNETWKTAGINDYVYLTSYFIMTIALIRFMLVMKKIKNTHEAE